LISEHFDLNKLLSWINDTDDLVMIINRNYKIQYLNDAAIKSFGNSLNEYCWSLFGLDKPCDSCPYCKYEGNFQPYISKSFINGCNYNVAHAKLSTPENKPEMLEVFREISDGSDIQE
jgi:hypothetical protein